MVRKFFIAAALTLALAACSGPISIEKVQDALGKAAPGDTVIVKDGVYADVTLDWAASANADKQVVVRPETPGGAVITGKSELKISGEGLCVASFLFKNCVLDKGSVVEFRSGDALASGCRLTDCAFDACIPARRDILYGYVQLYGRGNRVDHCSFFGKENLGVTLTVMLNYPDCDDNHHSIDHNWFGPRPVYGSNGAETIRVGTSHQCMQNSRSIIRDNLFERCDGEVEVVSIKSSENEILNNVFYECQGVLALRHGDRNRAEGNLFLGHGVRNTGGIRIVGEDQVIQGNKFIGLKGSRFFSALALMYGVPNSLPNRYIQVKRTIIRDNDFEGCAAIEFDTGKDAERTLAPIGTVWENNRVSREVTFAEPSFGEISAGKGASWFVPQKKNESESGRTVRVSASEDLADAVASAEPGSIIELTDSLYLLEKCIKVSAPVELRAAEGCSPLIRSVNRKSDDMIKICDGARLSISGLHFSGAPTPGRSIAKNIISTADNMSAGYSLDLQSCTFSDCGEGGFFVIRGKKGTFADRVVIRDCKFLDLSGDAVYFAAETDDKGRYSGDDLIIENCLFEHILGTCVNVYRGGSDESTAGPYVYIRDCSFRDASNKVRGCVLRLIGPQVLEISGCRFDGSGRGGSSIRLDEAPWEKITLKNNTFAGSGPVRRNL